MIAYDQLKRDVKTLNRFKYLKLGGLLLSMSIISFILAIITGIETNEPVALAFMVVGFVSFFAIFISAFAFLITFGKKDLSYRTLLLDGLWQPLLEQMTFDRNETYAIDAIETETDHKVLTPPVVPDHSHQHTMFTICEQRSDQCVYAVTFTHQTGNRNGSTTDFIGFVITKPLFDPTSVHIRKDTVLSRLTERLSGAAKPDDIIDGYAINGSVTPRINEIVKTLKSHAFDHFHVFAEGKQVTIAINDPKPLPRLLKTKDQTLETHKDKLQKILTLFDL